MISFVAFGLAALFAWPAHASDLDLCDFNKSNGSCSATHSLNRETNFYTVPSDGTCRTVTVQIDGTQYPHKQKDRSIVDSVMVLQKEKPYNFQISGCTAHPLREDVLKACATQNYPQRNACARQFEESMRGCDNDSKCVADTHAVLSGCFQISADSMNQCAGANALRVYSTGSRTGIEKTGEY